MKCYRISKYDPIYRSKEGIYQRDEWTSFCDIGRSFSGVRLTREEYKRVEDEYLSIALQVLSLYDISQLDIRMKEIYHSPEEIRAYLEDKGFIPDDREEYILNNLADISKIRVDNFPELLRLMLRECFWCVAEARRKIIIECGYDFYMYIYCDNIPDSIAGKYGDIFAEEINRDVPEIDQNF